MSSLLKSYTYLLCNRLRTEDRQKEKIILFKGYRGVHASLRLRPLKGTIGYGYRN